MIQSPVPDDPVRDSHPRLGVIAWFTHNPVAANLLMLLIIALGLMSISSIQRAVSPEIKPNIILITQAYPGAAPEEVESGLILKIEEALKDIDEIKRVSATADESLATITIEVLEDFDVLTVLDEVKTAVDAIAHFPEQAEKPVIQRLQLREHAVNIQVYGNLDERTMKNLVEQVRIELLREPEIAYAEIFGARDDEISIEISELTLRQYGLTLESVAAAIRASSQDLPGGAIKTRSGDIMVRTKGQAYTQQDFERIVLVTNADGTRLTIADLGTVRDGFVEQDGFALFNRQFSMAITVYAVGKQDAIKVADAAMRYVEHKRSQLPEGVHIDSWADVTYYLEGRLDMMLGNLAMGAVLVFIILGLFLDLKLAFWVMAGLPVCFLGTFILMPLEPVDVSINMISLFGFLLVLGIVVDDAIIIGESVYSETQLHGHNVHTVVNGTLKVAMPATFGVLTTMVAFVPTLLTEGVFAPFPAACGWVVVLCLTFSLIESKWILPAHLAHSRPVETGRYARLAAVPRYCNARLQVFIGRYYRPWIQRVIEYRYLTAAAFLALLILTAGLVAGGIVRYVMIPTLPSDFLRANLEMAEGTPDSETRRAHDRIQTALYALDEQFDSGSGGFIEHVFSWGEGGRKVSFMVELTKSENRGISSEEIVQRWRRAVGSIPGAELLTFSAADDMGGPPLGFKLIGSDMQMLRSAADELAEYLSGFQGVHDLRNSGSALRDEIILDIRPDAQALGLSLNSLGQQVRHAFYGAEAQRMQRGTEEVKVMVRYPRDERGVVADMENMDIRTLDGAALPFSAVANMRIEPGLSRITRIDGERALTVSADVDKQRTEPGRIVNTTIAEFMPDLQSRYPGLRYALDGESEEAGKLFRSLFTGFVLALFGIYALLAIPLKSYLQPLIIMSVIPFGIIGAVFGHLLIGIPFDMMSFFGVIALSGVVVNDSLIMVDFVNRTRAQGWTLIQAVIECGCSRFRAIMLTSLTTFFGLAPILLETSVQAQFVIPMAVSLAFGILFATVITLLLIPCLYMILDDLQRWWQRHQPETATVPA